MVQEFRSHLIQNFKELVDAKNLLAISGGVDSVVAAYLLKQAGLCFEMAHCNFQLREQESDKDEYFVKDLGLELEIPVHSIRFETEKYAENNKLSTQVAARELRYTWFEKLQKEHGFDFLITAHHLDDSLETFLINFSRGTGIDGLLGIPTKQSWIRRPFSIFSRKQIEQLAEENNIEWREDLSNQSDKYVRNKIRHQIIPKLKEINPSLAQSFSSTLNHLSHTKELSDTYIALQRKALCKPHPNYADLSLFEISGILDNAPLLYGLFNDYGFHNVKDLLNLCQAQSGKFLENDKYRLLKDREYLILENKSKGYTTPAYQIHVGDDTPSDSGLSVSLTKDLLNEALTVRKWENGDYFYPEDLPGKKKLSAYFRDQKFSIIDKERVQLLCHGANILWIIGDRRDKRYISAHKNDQIRITLIQK